MHLARLLGVPPFDRDRTTPGDFESWFSEINEDRTEYSQPVGLSLSKLICTLELDDCLASLCTLFKLSKKASSAHTTNFVHYINGAFDGYWIPFQLVTSQGAMAILLSNTTKMGSHDANEAERPLPCVLFPSIGSRLKTISYRTSSCNIDIRLSTLFDTLRRYVWHKSQQL